MINKIGLVFGVVLMIVFYYITFNPQILDIETSFDKFYRIIGTFVASHGFFALYAWINYKEWRGY